MLKNIIKFFAVFCIIISFIPASAMEIYTVKSGDYLYKIAKSHAIKGITPSTLTDSIKGINKSEIPGIVDNRIQVGNKLAIPTTKDEVDDGLTLVHSQIMDESPYSESKTRTSQGSYNNPSSSDVPMLIPDENESTSNQITQKTNLNNVISTSDEYSLSEENTVVNLFGKIFKIVIWLVIVFALGIVGKKIFDNKSAKKEESLELFSKKRRDHLMSRISPLVSTSVVYQYDLGLQEEINLEGSSNTHVELPDVGPSNELHISGLDTPFEHSDVNPVENVVSDDVVQEEPKTSATKTENGMVFETATQENLNISDDLPLGSDIQDDSEHDLHYVKELVEQYIDSEKFHEANITIQDSLEHNPNNSELRYMLLEVYARVKDEIAFDGEVHFIKSKNIVSMFDPLHQKIAKLRDMYFE